ncbi:MAG: hypothetical protein N2Z79_02410 [Candidatus Omnitrophica bacterium]|nr:hypothetical protein [Candidatus Omnitrophota bacterium]
MLNKFVFYFKLNKIVFFELEREISQSLGVSIRLKGFHLRRSSHDKNYLIFSSGKIIAIARVNKEILLRKKFPKYFNDNNLDFINREFLRFQREYEKYKKASEFALAPKPLYLEEGALVCEYIDAPDALSLIKKDKESLWKIFERVLIALSKLHKIGVIHRDASLYNTLICSDGRTVFIDMERGELPGMYTFQEYIVFDYLHLLDTSLKFFSSKELRFNRYFEIIKNNTGQNLNLGRLDNPEFIERYFPRIKRIDTDLKTIKSILKE